MSTKKLLTIFLMLILVLRYRNSLLTARPRLFNYWWRCQARSDLAGSKANLTQELNFLDKKQTFFWS